VKILGIADFGREEKIWERRENLGEKRKFGREEKIWERRKHKEDMCMSTMRQ
jgi:hypothetical protein